VETLLRRGVSQVWVHNGAKGSTIFSSDNSMSLHALPTNVVDCTGAGDSALSGFILGKYLGKMNDECLKIAHTLASEILQVHGAIDMQMSRSRLLTLVPKYFP
jgi:sugar/nucleoside kinase (ribokinase family)